MKAKKKILDFTINLSENGIFLDDSKTYEKDVFETSLKAVLGWVLEPTDERRDDCLVSANKLKSLENIFDDNYREYAAGLEKDSSPNRRKGNHFHNSRVLR